MEIIKSNKGKDKLLYEGYSYIVHKTRKQCIRWRCVEYQSQKVHKSFFNAYINL